jgi:hypothetical protein
MIASSSSRSCTATGTAGVLIRRRSEWRSGLRWSKGTGGGVRGVQSNTQMIAMAIVAPNKASRSGRRLSDADKSLQYSGPWIGTTPLPCASFSRESNSSSSFAFPPMRPLCQMGHCWGTGQSKWFSSEPLQRNDEETSQPTTIVASEPVVRGQVVTEEDVKKAEVHRTRLSEVRIPLAHTYVQCSPRNEIVLIASPSVPLGIWKITGFDFRSAQGQAFQPLGRSRCFQTRHGQGGHFGHD